MSKEKTYIRLEPELIPVSVSPAQDYLLRELGYLDAREAGDSILRVIQNYTGELDPSCDIDLKTANDISFLIRLARMLYDINEDFHKFAIA
jgi:hypothetical protein